MIWTPVSPAKEQHLWSHMGLKWQQSAQQPQEHFQGNLWRMLSKPLKPLCFFCVYSRGTSVCPLNKHSLSIPWLKRLMWSSSTSCEALQLWDSPNLHVGPENSVAGAVLLSLPQEEPSSAALPSASSQVTQLYLLTNITLLERWMGWGEMDTIQTSALLKAALLHTHIPLTQLKKLPLRTRALPFTSSLCYYHLPGEVPKRQSSCSVPPFPMAENC